jgi:uncharacterized protein (TIGR00730 family)
MIASEPTKTKSARLIKKLCVLCGSSFGVRFEYREAAIQLGRHLASSGIALVYGEARVGLMGVLADSVLLGGGQAIGVMPRSLVEKEIAHPALTQLYVVWSMHERKALMVDLADAFVLLPGGFGSWEEFCEVVTWLQLGLHHRPCGILNVAGYSDALMSLTAHAVAEGFLQASYPESAIVEEHPPQLLSQLGTAALPMEEKWVTTKERSIPKHLSATVLHNPESVSAYCALGFARLFGTGIGGRNKKPRVRENA